MLTWLVLQIWDMFEGTNMFKTPGGPENKYRTVCHLAQMFALLGPPPVDFLRRTEIDWIPWKYFDKQGESFIYGFICFLLHGLTQHFML